MISGDYTRTTVPPRATTLTLHVWKRFFLPFELLRHFSTDKFNFIRGVECMNFKQKKVVVIFEILELIFYLFSKKCIVYCSFQINFLINIFLDKSFEQIKYFDWLKGIR